MRKLAVAQARTIAIAMVHHGASIARSAVAMCTVRVCARDQVYWHAGTGFLQARSCTHDHERALQR